MAEKELIGQINTQGRIEFDLTVGLEPREELRVKLWPLDVPANSEQSIPSRPRIEFNGRVYHEGQIEPDESLDLPAGERVRVVIAPLYELPYDDDHEWNSVLFKSLRVLEESAEKAHRDHQQGKTATLDLESL